MIAILVPVLSRPQNVEPFLESVSVTEEPYRVYFICTAGDRAEIEACKKTDAHVLIHPEPAGKANFAKKINWAFGQTDEEWIFQAADDIRFSSGWDKWAFVTANRSRASVIGTNDLGNPQVRRGTHSTHTLFRRSYIAEYESGTVDGSGLVFSELYDHQWCCPPESPIWMGDLSFKSLGEVEIGDEVIGWERPVDDVIVGGRFPGRAPLKRLCVSRILAKTSRVAPIVRVVLASGRELRCTPDHRWFNALYTPSTPGRSEWIIPEVGRTLLHVIDQPQIPHGVSERIAGWLGGIYDGEGTGVYAAMQSQGANPHVVEAIGQALDLLEIPYRRSVRQESNNSHAKSPVVEFMLRNGRQGYLDFLNKAQPIKRTKLENKILNGKRFGHKDKIISVENAGVGEVISLTTESGNYIAWGYASKNCDNEFTHTAILRKEWAFSKRSIVEHLHPHWGKAQMDKTYTKAFRGTEHDLALFKKRLLVIKDGTHRERRARRGISA